MTATQPIKAEPVSSRPADTIQWGLLVIVAIMPFHAFLSVWLGHLTGHETLIQAWKEGLLLVLALGTFMLVWRQPQRLARLRQPWVMLVGSFMLIATLVTVVAHPALKAVAFGAKTDLEFLLAGLIALIVSDRLFLRRLVFTVLAGASLVVAFDVAQIFLLPADFLTHFGYGPDTIAPYQLITDGTDAKRFPGTLGGPNQLGTYLILPLALSLLVAKRRPGWLVLSIGSLIALFATYSRAAWLGAILAIVCATFYLVPRHFRRYLAVGIALAAVAGAIAFPLAVNPNSPWQYALLHSSAATHDQANRSDSQHLNSLKTGITEDLKAPLGHGLGTAGPATFHSDSTNIIENYFLQIGYETGLLGLLAFIGVLGLLIARLAKFPREPLAIAALAALAGISTAALVLPAWTDSSTALIAWICAGAASHPSGASDV